MSRKVYITSEMSIDERLLDVAEQDQLAALIWPWILTTFDDWGRAEAKPKKLKMKVFPGNEIVTVETIEAALNLYNKAGLIRIFKENGVPYIECVDWMETQYGGRVPINHWRATRERIFARDDYTCFYCGKRGGDLECDHLIPISRGGSNEDTNLVTSCKTCNRAKGSKLLEEWKK